MGPHSGIDLSKRPIATRFLQPDVRTGTLEHESATRTQGLFTFRTHRPHILDFLGLQDRYLEKDLEGAIDVLPALAREIRTRTKRRCDAGDYFV